MAATSNFQNLLHNDVREQIETLSAAAGQKVSFYAKAIRNVNGLAEVIVYTVDKVTVRGTVNLQIFKVQNLLVTRLAGETMGLESAKTIAPALRWDRW